MKTNFSQIKFKMSSIFLILTCAILVTPIKPNVTQNPIVRAGLSDKEAQEISRNIDRFVHERDRVYAESNKRFEERADFKLHLLLAQKPILRQRIENSIAVDKVKDSENKSFINRYDEKSDYRYKERYDSYKFWNDNTFKYKDNGRTEDRQSIEAVQNKSDADDTPNVTQNPIVRTGLSDKEAQEISRNIDRLVHERDRIYAESNKRFEERADFKLHLLLAQKPILRQRIENSNESIAVDNKVKVSKNNTFINRFEEKSDYRYKERYDSYTFWNDNTFKYKDNGRTEDRQSIEAVQNKSDADDSLKGPSDRNSQDNTFENLKYYLRAGLWKTCGKKAAETCRKACESAIQAGCSGTACKSKVKKRLKNDCKSACKDRFDEEDKTSYELDRDRKSENAKSSWIVHPYGHYGFYG